MKRPGLMPGFFLAHHSEAGPENLGFEIAFWCAERSIIRMRVARREDFNFGLLI